MLYIYRHLYFCNEFTGIYKKLEALGKSKKSEIVGQWARSISNHIYWCAMSSDVNGELILEKWMSILNHVCNIHEGHGQQFQRCEHGDLEDRVWIKRGMFIVFRQSRCKRVNKKNIF